MSTRATRRVSAAITARLLARAVRPTPPRGPQTTQSSPAPLRLLRSAVAGVASAAAPSASIARSVSATACVELLRGSTVVAPASVAAATRGASGSATTSRTGMAGRSPPLRMSWISGSRSGSSSVTSISTASAPDSRTPPAAAAVFSKANMRRPRFSSALEMVSERDACRETTRTSFA